MCCFVRSHRYPDWEISFANWFCRGNWRREDTTAPSLLAKSCHDIDFLMWLIASPASPHTADPRSVHLPSFISSTGTLNQFRKARKPLAAGSATNCLSCPIESSCLYSAKNIYVENNVNKGILDWPVDVVVPEMEDLYRDEGKDAAVKRLLTVLEQDYTSTTPNVKDRAWYGRCVWECDNDVCDDQVVTITWEDDPLPPSEPTNGHATDGTNVTKEENEPLAREVGNLNGRAAKTAIFHMIASTEKICERRGRIYGTKGELTYDLDFISVNDFLTGKTTQYTPEAATGGHGGGDGALAENFCRAVQAVNEGLDVEEAQRKYLGVTIEEVVRSHVAVFAAEKARKERRVVDWNEFWEEEVVGHLDTVTHEIDMFEIE
jgi:predicted dehydrogenase